MSVFEDLFNSAILELVVPDTSVRFPDHSLDVPLDDDEWLSRACSQDVDRKQAFFDEQLHALLLIRLSHSDSTPPQPSGTLISFLSHLQISLEATYISPHPASLSSPPPPPTRPLNKTNLSAPPRSDSVGRVKPRLNNLNPNQNPSIFPPATPNPTPSTAETDRQYVQAEGTLLLANIWGQQGGSGSGVGDVDLEEKFRLLWSEKEQVWVAVYRLALTVSFLRLTTSEPLLCLTVSATLREKRLPATTQPNHPFFRFLNTLTDVSPLSPPSISQSQSPTASTPASTTPTLPPLTSTNEDDDDNLTTLQEINLFSGLSSGPNFPSSGEGSVYVPSTRLGDSVRRTAFLLGSSTQTTKGTSGLPVTPTSAGARTPTAAGAASHTTLRKSFRKTLKTVSGFRVRMRTVFVPYVLLHPHSHSHSHSHAHPHNEDAKNEANEGDAHEREGEDEESRREAGNEERTVVLCVEVENSGESGIGVGFRVESVEVCIGGEGARAFLVGWGDRRQPHQHRRRGSGVVVSGNVGKGKGDGEEVFPLEIGSREQYNLLYAVSFLQNPDDTDGFSLGAGTGTAKENGGSGQELQRAVTINIVGKPVVRSKTGEGATEALTTEDGENTTKDPVPISTSYPTQSFTSRWNCILDLSPQPHRPPDHSSYDHYHYQYQNNQTPKIKDVMPEPASPFPMSQSQSQQYQQYHIQQIQQTPQPSATGAQGQQIAGSKRYTVPGAGDASVSGRAIKHTGVGMRASLTNAYQQQRERDSSSPKISYTPPSIAVQSQAGYMSSPTTYGPPSAAAGGGNGGVPRSSFGFDSPAPLDSPQSASAQHSAFPPQTSAYPAYPSHASASPSPLSHVPISSLQSGAVGPSVEIKRQRGFGAGSGSGGAGGSGAVMVQSPGPMVVGAERGMAMAAAMQNVVDEEGEPIVISIGLLPPPSHSHSESTSIKIYPLDTFTLDIFVFNQSTWTRRFEISSPDQRWRRKQEGMDARYGAGKGGLLRGLGDGDRPGILPLENRIRIGPLRPSTCQSVRMDFLAVTPGVHSIDTLTLTDIVSGYAMNLRSVMDVVVHEPQGS